VGRYLIDVVIAILLFLFVWYLLGRPIIRIFTPKAEPLPPIDKTSAVELKRLKADLEAKKAKLRNKREIDRIQEQINEVNSHLADLA
jgi:hypothetical protein